MHSLPDPAPSTPEAPPPRKRPARPVPRKQRWPELTIEQVLAWADAHYGRTGQWPTLTSGFVVDAPREKWSSVDAALRQGHRGLARGSSLDRLLTEHRGVRNRTGPPPLAVGTILGWADSFHARHGRWPQVQSGPIEAAPGESWQAVDMALRQGHRGLAGGSSLARLLEQQRGVRNRQNLASLTEEQILAWADAHRAATGAWPTSQSGAVTAAPGERWSAIHGALRMGARGLPGGCSLAHLLVLRRGARSHGETPPLTEALILAWADAHYARRGAWPTRRSGAIEDAPGETWQAIQSALPNGRRGLPGGSSLPRLLAEHRGVRPRLKQTSG
jgi:hypothetical protein